MDTVCRMRTRGIRLLSIAISSSIVVLASGAMFYSATAATVSGDSLKSRLSGLSEIGPGLGHDKADVQLFGVEPSPDGLAFTPPAFYASGEILALHNDHPLWYNSTTYIVLESPDTVIEIQQTATDGISGSGGNESIETLTQLPDDQSAIDFPTKFFGWRLESVRFFNGKLDGKMATLILVADKMGESESPSILDPTASAKVMISLYELQADKDDQPGHFVRMAHYLTTKSYCNTDIALFQELAIPLPALYAGMRLNC